MVILNGYFKWVFCMRILNGDVQRGILNGDVKRGFLNGDFKWGF